MAYKYSYPSNPIFAPGVGHFLVLKAVKSLRADAFLGLRRLGLIGFRGLEFRGLGV